MSKQTNTAVQEKEKQLNTKYKKDCESLVTSCLFIVPSESLDNAKKKRTSTGVITNGVKVGTIYS